MFLPRTRNLRLQAARLEKNWTQEQLAEKMNTTPISIQRWEAGQLPGKSNQQILCTLFKKSAQDLGFSANTEN